MDLSVKYFLIIALATGLGCIPSANVQESLGDSCEDCPIFSEFFQSFLTETTFDGPIMEGQTWVYVDITSDGDGLLSGSICHYGGYLTYDGEPIPECPEGADEWPAVEGVIDEWDGECFLARIYTVYDSTFEFEIDGCHCAPVLYISPPESSEREQLVPGSDPVDNWFACEN